MSKVKPYALTSGTISNIEGAMTFTESIRTCFSKYADFKGCATKSELWWWVLFVFITTIALGIISDKLSAVFSVATLLPYFAVVTRRLHDTDRSGWFQLWAIIPVIGWILLIYWCVQESKSPNRFA
ncbi:DUF805 domain-containing protein [Rhodoferax sp.]|uniref:DUF805 domain-containing protein n=1 Tax=Rhodoferax sp. TaxID=50421 RepID=UPI00262DF4E5|nr:DUF805 domain-containing protein [Rhodoferax sp.]